MNMFNFEFKRMFKSCFIWSVVCVAIVILFMSMFPSMKDMGLNELMGSKLDELPPAMLEAFNLSGNMDFTNLADYMGYTLQYVAMAVAIYGALLGINALSKEENDGTIEFLYSKPITRSKIVTMKILVSAITFILFVIIVGISGIIMNLIVAPNDMSSIDVIKETCRVFLGMILIGYIFMAIGFLLSVLFKAKKNNTSIVIGVFFTSYVLGILGKLKENLNGFIYLSPTDYFLPSKVLKDGFEIKYIVISTIIILVSIIITYVIYNRKELNS